MGLEFLVGDLLLHALPPQLPSTQLNALNPFDIAAVLGDWTWELTQLEEGPFTGSSTLLRLDPLLVGKITFNRALLQRIRCPPRGWTLITRSSESSSIFVAGQLLRPSEYVVLDAGTEIELLCHGAGTVIAISPNTMAAEGWRAADLCKSVQLPGRAQLVSCGNAALRNLPDCIDQVEAAVTSLPSLCPTPHLTAWLGRQLLSCLFRTMASVAPIDANPPRAARRRAAVERARAYIRKHLTEPIRLADLCQHAYIQQRSLEYGFQEIVGLSPMAYVKALRLTAVHRRLLIDPLGASSISQVALDGGFHHLGQFASDYKRLFLENPSTTRKRAQLQNNGGELRLGSTHVNGAEARPTPGPTIDTTRSKCSVAPEPRAQHDSGAGAYGRLVCGSVPD